MRIGPFSISRVKSNSINILKGLSAEELGRYVSCLTGGYSEENMLTLFKTIPEVFAPIDTIAGAVSSAVWQLRRIKNDEVVYDHKEWNRIYDRPNWKQDFSKLIYNAVVYKYVTGNRYFYTYVPETLVIKLANVKALWLLPPQYTEIRLKTDRPVYLVVDSSSDLIEYYDFASGRDRMKIKPEYVSHDTFLDFENDEYCDLMKGISPLRACEYPMSNLIAVYEARNVIYVKRGALGFMVSKKGDASGLQPLTKSEREQLLKDFHETYGVNGGKSPIGITNLPVEYIRVGLSIAELEPFKETDVSADAVYAALRVPRELKPRAEGATYENQKTARRTLYTNIAIPEANQLAVIISKMLRLTDEGFYLYPSFEHIEDLQENKKEKSEVDWKNNETQRVRFLHGIVTLNDWIVSCGLEKVTGVPIYDKRVFQMDEAEFALVKAVIGMKSVSVSVSDSNTNTDDNK